MYFNKEIIFKNKESQAVATIRHFQKYIFLQKTRAECQIQEVIEWLRLFFRVSKVELYSA